MDLYVLERQLRAAERELAQEVRAGEADPGSPFAALRCERLHRTVGALRRRRKEMLRSVADFEPHAVPPAPRAHHPRRRVRAGDEAPPFDEGPWGPPLPARRLQARTEQWLHEGEADDEGAWEWNGRALRVVKNVVYSDSEVLEALLAKARALEAKMAALEAGRGAAWSEETKSAVEAGAQIGEERQRAREAAREQLRKRAAVLRQEHEQNSAIIVQSTFRGFLGRRKMREARAKYEEGMRQVGARRIQAHFRGHMARVQVRHRKAEMERDLQAASATVIQSAFRGAQARRAYRSANTAEERQAAAAALIQAWWRGCVGRREALSRRSRYLAELEEVAAVMLQTAWRCFQARKERERLEIERAIAMEEAAAIMLQSAWRAYQARRRVESIRREREDVEHELKTMDYADNVRKTLFAKLFLNDKQRAAVAIQACARGFLERKRLRARRERLAQRDREDAAIDRMLEHERERRQGLGADTPAAPAAAADTSSKTVFEDTLNLPVHWADAQREFTPVHVLVRERKAPYQLRIEAEEQTSRTQFYRMIDTSVLEELLLPVFADVENNAGTLNNTRQSAIVEPDARPLVNWVLHGEPPRRKDLIAWILNRMWLDQNPADGVLELCLGSLANTDHLDKTMSTAIPPSSPPSPSSRAARRKGAAKPTREAFKVKYRNTAVQL